MELPDLGANLSTLSVALNSLTGQGLGTLILRVPRVASLDLKGNNMMFTLDSVVSLWQDGWDTPSALRHLNVSSNAPDLVGYAHLFWMVGR